jgi:ribosomal protein S18 acetylase RimI-like enzyme
MVEVQHRRARASDLESLLDLWTEMMYQHACLDPRFAAVEDPREVFRDTMRQWITSTARRVVVATVDGRVVGYAIGSITENPPILRLRHYGHISDICVAREWRQHGVGRRLYGALRTWFRGRGIGVVQLNVASLNPVAQAFWREMGFQDYMDRMWLEL